MLFADVDTEPGRAPEGELWQPAVGESASEGKVSSAQSGRFQLGDRRVTLTHLNRTYFPQAGFTKRDLLEYYYQLEP